MKDQKLPLYTSANDHVPADPDLARADAGQLLHQIAKEDSGSPRVDSLYLHIPFCYHICHYCDFYSIADNPQANPSKQRAFTQALIREIDRAADLLDIKPRTIFVGGGTPTYLLPEFWEQILAALNKHQMLDAVTEFTVEANPETVTAELIQLLVDAGVNRFSIGAQSFDRQLLKNLERTHDPKNIAKSMEIIRQTGVSDINLDLIFAIPGQTPGLLIQDIQRALSYEPTHMSIYSLTYEPHTPLTQKRNRGLITPIDNDTDKQMFQIVLEQMPAGGFAHYEISNWAKIKDNAPGDSYQCQHNLNYWFNANWMGFGPNAASHLRGHRWKNKPHLGQYSQRQAPPVIEYEHLKEADRIGEELMLRLRLIQGVCNTWINAHCPAGSWRGVRIAELIGLGFLEADDRYTRLTGRGLFVADSVISELL